MIVRSHAQDFYLYPHDASGKGVPMSVAGFQMLSKLPRRRYQGGARRTT